MREMSLEQFLTERLKETQEWLSFESIHGRVDLVTSTRLIHAIDAQLAMVAWHEQFPVLIEGPIEYRGPRMDDDDFLYRTDAIKYEVTQRLDIWTRDEYVRRMGTWPPALQLMKDWAKQYDKHPDYNPEWVK